MATQDTEALSHQTFVEEIDYNEIQPLEVVGKGSFGVVWKGIWRDTYVAVKHINSEAERKAFAVEVRQLSRVSHPNIVRLYGACSRGSHVCLVMEYAEGGSLYNVLHCHPRPRYNAAHAMSWSLQCAEGVAYLHAMRPKPLIHRDLKPPNLLLVMGGQRLKICDFGTAADKSTYMTNNKGSAAWMAPEVFEGSSYTEKCDVFSWGIILWEVLSRKKPFDEIGGSAFRIMWAVHTGQRPPLMENCPAPIEDLMTRCWHQIPDERPSMETVVATMTNLMQFFPGVEEPVEYISDDSSVDYNEDDQNMDSNQTYSSYEQTHNTVDPNQRETFDSIGHTNNQEQLNNQDSNNFIQNVENNSLWSNSNRQMPNEHKNDYWRRDNNVCASNPRDVNSSDVRDSAALRLQGSNPSLMTPLQLHVEPNAWDLDTDPSVEMEVRNMAGFDKYVPVKRSSSGASNRPPEPRQGPPDGESADLDSMCLMLDPHLRPATPDATNRLSLQVFEEHKQLAQEYLKVQTEIAYLSQHKNELTASLGPEDQKQRQDIRKLEEERDALLKLYSNLKRQLEIMQTSTPGGVQHQQQDNDGWVLVPNTLGRD